MARPCAGGQSTAAQLERRVFEFPLWNQQICYFLPAHLRGGKGYGSFFLPVRSTTDPVM